MVFPLTYASVGLPTPDADGYAPVLQPIDDAERNANGDLILTPIVMKRTVGISWSLLRGDRINALWALLEANRTGPLVFYNISKGAMDTMQVYWGTGPKANFRRYDENLKSQIWTSLAVNFIEM